MKEEILEYFKDINHAYNDCTRFDTLKRMLGELQEPKTGRWIPVSERLPEIKNHGQDLNFSETVLVTTRNKYGMNNVRLACIELPHGWIFESGMNTYGEVVVAWMPLPEPYKKEKEGEE